MWHPSDPKGQDSKENALTKVTLWGASVPSAPSPVPAGPSSLTGISLKAPSLCAKPRLFSLVYRSTDLLLWKLFLPNSSPVFHSGACIFSHRAQSLCSSGWRRSGNIIHNGQVQEVIVISQLQTRECKLSPSLKIEALPWPFPIWVEILVCSEEICQHAQKKRDKMGRSFWRPASR